MDPVWYKVYQMKSSATSMMNGETVASIALDITSRFPRTQSV